MNPKTKNQKENWVEKLEKEWNQLPSYPHFSNALDELDFKNRIKFFIRQLLTKERKRINGLERKKWEDFKRKWIKEQEKRIKLKNEPERDYNAEGEAEMEARDKYEAEMEDQAEKERQAEYEANQPPPEEPPF